MKNFDSNTRKKSKKLCWDYNRETILQLKNNIRRKRLKEEVNIEKKLGKWICV